MMEQVLGNWICWVILGLALVCYYQISMGYLSVTSRSLQGAADSSVLDMQELDIQRKSTSVLIGALPLLGLLGTIIGLLECFMGMANEGASSELVSSGIADALLTTQIGLVCAIPAWLLQGYVKSITARVVNEHNHSADSASITSSSVTSSLPEAELR